MPDRNIRPEFAVHLLNDKGKQAAHDIAEAFTVLLTAIETHVPKSRELSLVVTHLQDAAFWAKRGMAINLENQQPAPSSD